MFIFKIFTIRPKIYCCAAVRTHQTSLACVQSVILTAMIYTWQMESKNVSDKRSKSVLSRNLYDTEATISILEIGLPLHCKLPSG